MDRGGGGGMLKSGMVCEYAGGRKLGVKEIIRVRKGGRVWVVGGGVPEN